MKLQELGKVDVELLTAEAGVHLRCKKCGAKRTPDTTPGGTLMAAFNACKGILLDARGVDLRITWADKLRVALALARAQVRGHPVAALADPQNVNPGRASPASLSWRLRAVFGTIE